MVMVINMKCPRCGNDDPHLIGAVNGRPYCRACIKFNRQFLDERIESQLETRSDQQVSFHLSFELSEKQEEISQRLISNYDAKVNTAVMAVCGSGKTEMTYAVMAHVLNLGGRVCFAIPRRALCIELYERIKQHFEGVTIGVFFGGCHLHMEAPLIICTTHQLYRFVSCPFDLILLDEADAFPYYNDEVLKTMLRACTKRCTIKMSATLLPEDCQNTDVLIMNRRYHGADLPVPRIVHLPPSFWKTFLLIKVRQMRKRGKRVIVYVPLLPDVAYYVKYLSSTFKVKGVSSQAPDISLVLDEMRHNSLDVVVTTTILERGITVEDVQVIVINASHTIYDERTLMQIAGRVGRSPAHPSGDIYLLDQCVSKDMKSCIKTIKSLNQMSA